MFSKPITSWGFGSLEQIDDVPVKIENDVHNYQDILMSNGDDTDSDVEVLTPLEYNANIASQNRQAHLSQTASPTSPASRRDDRGTRKRRDSPLDLSDDKSPRKKSHTSFERSENEMSTLGGRTARVQLPSPHVGSASSRSRQTLSMNTFTGPRLGSNLDSMRYSSTRLPAPKHHNKTPRLGGNLDFMKTSLPNTHARQHHNETPILGGNLDSMRSLLTKNHAHKHHGLAASNTSHSNSRGSPVTEPHNRTSTFRFGLPFDEDDSEEDFQQDTQMSSESQSTTPGFKSIFSEPNVNGNEPWKRHRPNHNAASRPSGNEGSRKIQKSSKAPSHLDKIRHQRSIVSNTPSWKPAIEPVATPLKPTDSSSSITASRFSSSAFPRFESTILPRRPGVENRQTSHEDIAKSIGAERCDTSARSTQLDEQRRRRQEISRKKQEEMITGIKASNAVMPSDDEEGDNIIVAIPNLTSSNDDPSPSDLTTTDGLPNAPDLLTTDNLPKVTSPSMTDDQKYTAMGDIIVSNPVMGADNDELRRKREEASNARKEADLRREADAKQRAQAKTEAERVRWEKEQKVKEARREDARRKQRQADEEARVLAERTAALSKLPQVKPAKSTSTGRQGNQKTNSSLSGLLATVSSRSDKAPLFEQPLKVESLSQPTSSHEPSIYEELIIETASDRMRKTSTILDPTAVTEDTSRDQRIQQMKERNEKRRIAEMEERRRQTAAEKEEEHRQMLENEKTQNATTASHSRPTGPVALNSIAGQKLVAASQTKVHIFGEDEKKGSVQDERSHQRRLGEIRPEDVELVKWNQMTMDWREITQLMQKKYSLNKAERTWSRRCKQVKDAMNAATISNDFKERLYSGDENARRELNQKINGDQGTVPDSSTPQQTNKTAMPVRSSMHVSPRNKNFDNNRRSSISPESSFESQTLAGSPPPDFITTPRALPVRPSTGGKIMNEQAFKHYLEGLNQAWQEDIEEIETIRQEREPSPFTDDDYAHFAYQVERRELHQEDIEDGEDIENRGWLACGRAFDNLRAANREAIRQIFRAPRRCRPAIDVSNGYEHKNSMDNGMEFHELKGGPNGGVRQVRVTRFRRTLGDDVLPESKHGWAPRDFFFVKKRTTVLAKEEIFGDTIKETSTTDFENKFYTSLGEANIAAVEKFVQIGFTPTSRHLATRGYEIQEVEKELMDELDEGEFFYQIAKDDTEERKIEVEIWVEEAELEGARNLW